jgi:hypothetical protein
MRFFLTFIAPILAFLWLAKVHPFGALVMIILYVTRCAFKNRVLTHIFSHFVYDLLKGFVLGLLRRTFGRK